MLLVFHNVLLYDVFWLESLSCFASQASFSSQQNMIEFKDTMSPETVRAN